MLFLSLSGMIEEGVTMTKRTFSTESLGKDLLIGVLIALVSIPISMGYAMVAGLPAIYGLYGSFLPILIYGLLTSSPRFVFGVDAAPAALTGALLASLGIASGSDDAVRIMPLITILVSLWLLLFFVLKANRLLKFISHPVMGGFITGIGITIICMQIPKLFGGTSGSGELIELLVHIYDQGTAHFHLPSLLLGLGTIAVILVCRHFLPKLPTQAIVMVLGALATVVFPLKESGIACLPSVDQGLPALTLPDFTLFPDHYQTLLVSTFTIAVVILSETLLASSNLALKHEEKLRPRREILAYSLGNVAAAATGCCPVNGSVSRSGIADQFKVNSQWMSVSASLTMVLILLFGTGFISYLPVPVLTGIVISALISTFEFSLARKLRKVDKAEYIIFWAALLAVLLMGTIYGVIVGVLLSSITFIVRQSRPKIEILGVDPEEEGYHSLKRKGNYTPIREVLLYRFSGALFYANISDFEAGLTEALKPDTRVIVIDAAGISSVDVTAAEYLLGLYHKFRRRDIRFYLAGHVTDVNAELRAFGAEELIREGAVRSRISLALRDAGYDKPYILEDSDPEKKNTYSKQLAELSWAYGDNAERILEEIAKKIAHRLTEDPETDLESLLAEEKQLAHGYWNYADEDEFLDYLEMQFVLHLEENSKHKPAGLELRIEERIAERHLLLEEKILERDPAFVERLRRHRARRDENFRKLHPETYKRLQDARQKYMTALRDRIPKLAAMLQEDADENN